MPMGNWRPNGKLVCQWEISVPSRNGILQFQNVSAISNRGAKLRNGFTAKAKEAWFLQRFVKISCP